MVGKIAAGTGADSACLDTTYNLVLPRTATPAPRPSMQRTGLGREAGLMHTLRRSSVNLMHVGASFGIEGTLLGMLKCGSQWLRRCNTS